MSRPGARVAILGAGVAGLASAKTLQQYGFDVTVYEARPELGGVWANNYKSLCVLEPNCVYGYPDWPWPAAASLFPPAAQVRDYLASYARHFDIADRIVYNAPVTRVTAQTDGRWTVEFGSAVNAGTESFDHFVMAPGMFNIPKIPDWPGRDRFAGEVIHSSELRDTAQIKGRRVAIIGFSRSAMDIAVDIVDDAQSVTLVHRSVRWPVPEKILGLVRNHILLFSRWPVHFAPQWIRPTHAGAFLHGKATPVVAAFWKFFEVLLTRQFGLKQLGLVPDKPIRQDLFTNLYVTPQQFFTHVRNGLIGTARGAIDGFESNAVRLADGRCIDADVVICATGWQHDYSFLPAEMTARIRDEDGMHLYRHMVHPDYPGFAFVGGVQGINSATCYAVQATWLARYLAGQFSLPERAAQIAEIEARRAWNRELVTPRPNRSQILNLHQLPYLDDLLVDMGLNPRRKALVLDQLAPYVSADYREVVSV